MKGKFLCTIIAVWLALFFLLIPTNNSYALTLMEPIITDTAPATNTTNVEIGSIITVIFSKDMDASTINSSTFMLKLGETAVTGTVSYDADTRTALFIPSSPLAYDSTYSVTLTEDIKDSTGNALLTSPFTWTFSTALLKGDVNNDKVVDIGDAIVALQVISQKPSPQNAYKEADINNDRKVGMAEAIYALQIASSLRIPASILTVTDADDGKFFTIPQGSVLTVELASNLTNGYSWAISASDPGVFQKISSTYVEDEACAPGMTDCGGREIWTFRAPNAAYVTQLKMSYYRPSMGEESAETTFALNLYVTGTSDTLSIIRDDNFTLTDTLLTIGSEEELNFEGFASAILTGGSANNTINVSGWSGTVTIYATAGNDTVTGNGANTTLISQNTATTWSLTAANAGTITTAGNTTTFTDVGNLVGGSGSDTLTGLSSGDIYTITEPNTITLTAAAITATSIEGIVGSTGEDVFTLTSGVSSFNGTISGGGGSDTLISASGDNAWTLTEAKAGTLNSTTVFNNISTLTGGIGTDTVSVISGDIYTITGENAVTLTTGAVNASSMDTLVGGAGTETFRLSSGVTSFNGTIVGADGIDTLTTTDGADTWTITGANSGTLKSAGDAVITSGGAATNTLSVTGTTTGTAGLTVTGGN